MSHQNKERSNKHDDNGKSTKFLCDVNMGTNQQVE